MQCDDSIVFKDQVSLSNYSNLVDKSVGIVIEHQPADDNYIHYYTSEDVFKQYDNYTEDTLFTLDKVKDNLPFLDPPSNSNYRNLVMSEGDTAQFFDTPAASYIPVEVRQKIGGIFEKVQETVIEHNPRFNSNGRTSTWPTWEWGPNTAITLWKDKDFGGSSYSVMDNVTSTVYNTEGSEKYFSGIKYACNLNGTDMYREASSFRVANQSTRVMRVDFLVYGRIWCNDYHRIIDVKARKGPTYWTAEVSDLKNMYVPGGVCHHDNKIGVVYFSFGYEDSSVTPLVWTNHNNTANTFNGIKKTSGSQWWNAGATSYNAIGNNKFQYIINSVNDDIMFGINYQKNTDVSWNGIPSKIYISKYRGQQISLWQGSSQTQIYLGTYQNGDVIIVEPDYTEMKVYYYKNSDYIGYHSLSQSTVYGDLSMYNLNAECQDTKKRSQ